MLRGADMERTAAEELVCCVCVSSLFLMHRGKLTIVITITSLIQITRPPSAPGPKLLHLQPPFHRWFRVFSKEKVREYLFGDNNAELH